MSERIWRWEHEGRWAYIGAALYAYQLTFGVSLRWYGGQPHFRFYVGPVKLYVGIFLRSGQPAFSGGDR